MTKRRALIGTHSIVSATRLCASWTKSLRTAYVQSIIPLDRDDRRGSPTRPVISSASWFGTLAPIHSATSLVEETECLR
jgi:hypothetical protein